MDDEAIARIRKHPKFVELIEKRTRYGWTLALVMLAIYYGFILIIAFVPQLLGIPLGPGVITTIGIPLGILVILAAFVLTGLYVRRANDEFDALERQVVEAAK